MKLPRIATKKAYGDAMGPFGFPMPSDLAHEVDTALKSVSKELVELFGPSSIDGLCRITKAVEKMDFAEGERADVSLISTAALDRDKEVVMPGGLDWGTYKKNPVVGYGHNYDILPVGRSMWWKRAADADPSKDGWLAKTQYTKKPEGWDTAWFPDAVWHMVRNGDLKGKSVGFVPLDGRRPTPDDIKKHPYMADARVILTKGLVVEYSVVGVQSNPTSVVQAVAKSAAAGFPVPLEVLKSMGLIIDEGLSSLDELVEEDIVLPSIKNCRSVKNMEELKKQMLNFDLQEIVNDSLQRAKGIV